MKYISTSTAAQELGITQRRVLALIKAGRLPSMQLGREHLIKTKDLELVRVRKPGRPKQ
jgi:excisionase family DNA binding protein